jgi:hypothetical protein
MTIQHLPQLEFDRLFDLRSSKAIQQASADPEEAARVLLIAAEYLREHKPLPYQLADYLADAFESAMAKAPEKRLAELGFELNLKSKNKRPHRLNLASAYAIVQQNFHLVDQSRGYSNVKTPALLALLKGQGGCSVSHARSILDQIDKALQVEAAMLSNTSNTTR